MANLADSSADVAQELRCANAVIQKDFAFDTLSLSVDEKALLEVFKVDQQQAYTISLSRATHLALGQIFDNYETVESPLSIAAMGWSETTGKYLSSPLKKTQKHAISAYLRTQIQNQKTSLSLFTGTTVQGLSYPPEQGEAFDSNWVFVLRIPSLSDHIYWIIVDKKGQRAPYVYGFN